MLHMQAISAWRDNSGFGRVQLVKQYFLSVEGEHTCHAWSTESVSVCTHQNVWEVCAVCVDVFAEFLKPSNGTSLC